MGNESILLSQIDIKELTGYVRPSCQSRWLDQHGYSHKRAANGRIVLSKAYVESKLSGQKPKLQLNFDALKGKV
mgnify:CR=1 FL=1